VGAQGGMAELFRTTNLNEYGTENLWTISRYYWLHKSRELSWL